MASSLLDRNRNRQKYYIMTNYASNIPGYLWKSLPHIHAQIHGANKDMFTICLAITCYIILMLGSFDFDLIIDLVFDINFVRNKCIKYTDVVFVYLRETQPSNFYVCG